MILHPWILGLIVCQSILLLIFSRGVFHSWEIVRGWDYDSTEERQIQLEKKTVLVSVVMNFVFISQIVMLFFFVLAANDLARILPGAMCAVGTLGSNSYGFPLLYLKIFSFFVYFGWLMINHLDNQLETYPLVQKKHLALLFIYPIMLMETALLFLFTFNLDPLVITSCCGSIFRVGSESWGGSLASLPHGLMVIGFFGSVILLLVFRMATRRYASTFAVRLSLLECAGWIFFFIISVALVISFVSVYIYEMPAHKCPFCLLGPEYHCYGLPLFGSLFLGTCSGLSGASLLFFQHPEELRERAKELRSRLNKLSMVGISGFVVFAFFPFIKYYAKTGRFI